MTIVFKSIASKINIFPFDKKNVQRQMKNIWEYLNFLVIKIRIMKVYYE